MWWATTRTPTWRLTRTSGRLIRTCAALRPITSASGTMCAPAPLSLCHLSRFAACFHNLALKDRGSQDACLTLALLSMPVPH